MRIIDRSRTRRGVAALLDRRPAARPADRAPRRPNRARACAARETRRCSHSRRRFDGLDGPGRGRRARRSRPARARTAPTCSAAIRAGGAPHPAASRAGRCRARWTVSTGCRRARSSSACSPLDRVGCYVPGGRYPLPSSLLMTAIPARVAGVPRSRRRLPAARRHGPVRRARGRRRSRCSASAARTPIAALAYGTATVPRWTRSSGRATPTSPRPRRWSRRDCAIDFFAGPSEIAIVSVSGPAGVDRRRPHRTGRARSRRARDPDHAVQAPGASGRRRDRHADAGRRAGADSLARNGGIVVTRSLDEAVALSQRLAPEHLVCDSPRRRRG